MGFSVLSITSYSGLGSWGLNHFWRYGINSSKGKYENSPTIISGKKGIPEIEKEGQSLQPFSGVYPRLRNSLQYSSKSGLEGMRMTAVKLLIKVPPFKERVSFNKGFVKGLSE